MARRTAGYYATSVAWLVEGGPPLKARRDIGRSARPDRALSTWASSSSARLALLTVVLLVLAVACAPSARPDPGPNAARPTPRVEAVAALPSAQPPTPETARMLALVNDARASSRRCGRQRLPAVAPLVWDEVLARAADHHSRAMALQGFVSHVSPSGSTVGDRIAAVGYTARSWGETIAAGYVDPEETVAGFLASPSHCEVLMAASFEALGAALVEHGPSVYGSYWTLVFAAPR